MTAAFKPSFFFSSWQKTADYKGERATVKDNMMQKQVFFQRIFWSSLVLLLAVSFAQAIAEALTRGINPDEREHLYATFMVYHGRLPYRDFFEHHHPLLWYVFAPMLYFYGNSADVLYVMRWFGIVVMGVLAFYIYGICRCAGAKPAVGILSVACWLNFVVVRWSGTEFRPDNLMMMFFIAGMFYFFRYLQGKQFVFLLTAFLLFWLSFAALQKIVFLFVPLAAVIGKMLFRKEIAARDFFMALIIPAVLTVLSLAWLYRAGGLKDYFELNWLLNSKIRIAIALVCAAYYYAFALGVFAAVVLYFFSSCRIVRLISLLYLMQALLLLACWLGTGFKLPYQHYLLPFYPYLAIMFGFLLAPFLRYKYSFAALFAAAGFLVWHICGVAEHAKNDSLSLHIYALTADIILKNSAPEDLVLGNIDYLGTVGGLRQNASGYYWFSHVHMAALDYRYFHRREMPYFNQIIKVRRPKIIANVEWQDCVNDSGQLDWNVCAVREKMDEAWMNEHYENHGFIWIRKD